jgi:hypothetical protein
MTDEVGMRDRMLKIFAEMRHDKIAKATAKVEEELARAEIIEKEKANVVAEREKISAKLNNAIKEIAKADLGRLGINELFSLREQVNIAKTSSNMPSEFYNSCYAATNRINGLIAEKEEGVVTKKDKDPTVIIAGPPSDDMMEYFRNRKK